jgi:hypothetical protein
MDLLNITDAERLDGKQWDCKDIIAQCLLSKCLPIETAMDIDTFTTAEVQWSAINTLFTTKSMYKKANLHQAILNMCCPKGGDIQEFLTSLKIKHHKLTAVNVSVTDTEYQCTILQEIPDVLSNYAT